jgi:hydroxyacylglutathione hydrolase
MRRVSSSADSPAGSAIRMNDGVPEERVQHTGDPIMIMRHRFQWFLTAVVFAAFSVAPALDGRPPAVAAAGSAWYAVDSVATGVWRIDDHGGANVWLVEGKDKALLIDTGTGVSDLAACVRSLTRLPVIVVNTHGHPDHAGGNFQFDSVYAHPADIGLIGRFTERQARASSAQRALKEAPDLDAFILRDAPGFDIRSVRPVTDGFRFELGGRSLEVIETPGHTQGSICLLDAENRLLFAGDNDNSLVWLFLKDCLPLEDYLAALLKLKTAASKFETLLPGHGVPLDAAFLDEQIACCRAILSGECAGEPYRSFAGEARVCAFGRASVAFDQLNLRRRTD